MLGIWISLQAYGVIKVNVASHPYKVLLAFYQPFFTEIWGENEKNKCKNTIF